MFTCLHRLALIFLLFVLCQTDPAHAAEYFVSKQGNDAHSGTSRSEAFLTIQRGVDALQTGDTLTILPGEYFESVSRKGLGNSEKETLIRAEIPGTVLLRGDIPQPKFRRWQNYRFIYETEVPKPVQAVFEADSFARLERQGNPEELEASPGCYHYDAKAKKLYISSTDFRPVSEHRYVVSVNPANGFYLEAPTRVTVDGIAATGFSSELPLRAAPGHFAAWGIIFSEGTDTVVRNATAFFNGGGILGRTGRGSGNLIENSTAYGNYSPHSAEGGNIMFFSPRRDVIRGCVSFRSQQWGIRLYGSRKDLTDKDGSRIEDSLGWGNKGADIFVKGGGVAHRALTKNSVAVSNGHALNVENVLIGMANQYLKPENAPEDTVFLNSEKIKRDLEFADPINFDFRPQATSRLITAENGKAARGLLPRPGGIYFVNEKGDDARDGRSLGQAWKSLEHALAVLKPGDTLYLGAGTYQVKEPIRFKPQRETPPISIRGRGTEQVIINGPLEIQGSHGLEFVRINFNGRIIANKVDGLVLDDCRFFGPMSGVHATDVAGLKVTHCEFTGSEDPALRLNGGTGAFLSSNIFDNSRSAAIDVRSKSGDGSSVIAYSDYNSYTDATRAWTVNGSPFSLKKLRPGFDRYSHQQKPVYKVLDGIAELQNPTQFLAGGALGNRLGVDQKVLESEIHMTAPRVVSTTATTANLEWSVSDKTHCLIAWGDTPACSETLEYTAHMSNNLLGSYSLTGLKPDTEYYFQIRSLDLPAFLAKQGTPRIVDPKFEVISFRTAKSDPPPRQLYVAPDGSNDRSGLSRKDAWLTIRHAAAQARPGDTVFIAGGTYTELVRIKATGDEGRPIVFKAMPGEKVIMDSDEKRMDRAFILTGKNYVTLDGLYFNGYRLGGWHTGIIDASLTNNTTISRCFFDARGYGYTSSFVSSTRSKNLTLSNCVFLNGIYGINIAGCTGLKIEHNVFAPNMIEATMISATGPGNLIRNNIFTDNSPGKVKVWLHIWGGTPLIKETNNCYVLRVPDEERKLFWVLNFKEDGKKLGHVRMSIREYSQRVSPTDSIVADPGFPAIAKRAPEKEGYAMDLLIRGGALDFPDFFTTNPEVSKRGIGLQPEAFADFHFQAKEQGEKAAFSASQKTVRYPEAVKK